MTRVARLGGVIAVLALVACGEGGSGPGPVEPPPSPDSLVVQHTGRLERGGAVQFTALHNGTAVTAAWSAEPASAVEWTGAGAGRLLVSGSVRIAATAGEARGSAALQVEAPPSVAFERVVDGQRDIWRIALDGGDLLRLSQHNAEDVGPSSAQGSVFFLSYRVAPAAVYSVSADGGAGTRVTTVAGEYRDVAVSPDGSRLAFIRFTNGIGRLYVSNRDGSGAARVTASTGPVVEAAPAWSPDSRRVAFVSTAEGNADVWIAALSGGAPQRVTTTTAAEVEPAFSPEGERIAFARATADGADLWSVHVASGAERQLTNRPGVEARPAWLPDGRIVFTITEGTERRLFWLEHDAAQSLHSVSTAVSIEGRPAVIR